MARLTSTPLAAQDVVEGALKFLFSALPLGIGAIIVSGKFLGQIWSMSGQDGDWIRLRLPLVLDMKAEKHEVGLGFGLFIFDLLLVAAIGGQGAYFFVRERFGIDLGQLSSICVFSAFLSVALSGFLLLLVNVIKARARRREDPLIAEHRKLIDEISQRPQGGGEGGA